VLCPALATVAFSRNQSGKSRNVFNSGSIAFLECADGSFIIVASVDHDSIWIADHSIRLSDILFRTSANGSISGWPIVTISGLTPNLHPVERHGCRGRTCPPANPGNGPNADQHLFNGVIGPSDSSVEPFSAIKIAPDRLLVTQLRQSSAVDPALVTGANLYSAATQYGSAAAGHGISFRSQLHSSAT
jgi:hypothetical protein